MDMKNEAFEVLEAMERMPRISRRSGKFNRMDVVTAFSNAFEIIGGVSRLALWANENPDKFYPLYARLMPATSMTINTEGSRLIIEHVIPPTELDDFTGVMGYGQSPVETVEDIAPRPANRPPHGD